MALRERWNFSLANKKSRVQCSFLVVYSLFYLVGPLLACSLKHTVSFCCLGELNLQFSSFLFFYRSNFEWLLKWNFKIWTVKNVWSLKNNYKGRWGLNFLKIGEVYLFTRKHFEIDAPKTILLSNLKILYALKISACIYFHGALLVIFPKALILANLF